MPKQGGGCSRAGVGRRGAAGTVNVGVSGGEEEFNDGPRLCPLCHESRRVRLRRMHVHVHHTMRVVTLRVADGRQSVVQRIPLSWAGRMGDVTRSGEE